MSERPAYAFIGLGHLGGHLAASLVRNGFDVTVFDRDPPAVERLVALGASAVNSPAEAAA
ncbi:NAD(P)-binding domain-containing protein, partial [Mesorhizobium sp.]